MAHDEHDNVSPINPSVPTDAELEALLDEESDEEFGQPRLDETTKAVLKEWTAQDFASIYTRFRPHLERHARRFLRNQSQVDEVVQDAFLYLMVTLPELDSELGVLRFLKWKTRLLCLDVIRASGRAQLSDIDAHPEFEALNADVSADIEQAEDAAIVRLALSKLNPRHREVLIASMYEEKTSAQIAAQVGLTENATNQLIFRARAAFKKALLGDDVDTTGMSTAKILSVAARKAALEAKKVGAQAMVFALFLILGIGAFINFSGRNPAQISAAPEQSPSTSSAPAPVVTQSPTEPGNPAPTTPSQSVQVSASKPKPSPSTSVTPFTTPWAVDDLFESAFASTKLVKSASVKTALVRHNYTAVNASGVSAKFSFLAESAKPFQDVVLTIEIEGKTYTTKALDGSFKVSSDAKGNDVYTFIAKVGALVDSNGLVWANTALEESSVSLSAVFDNGSSALVGSSIGLSAKE